jgi:sterol desaturase/sphingolipid hydroxylase (fatty acid hydroxylase superfamily)
MEALIMALTLPIFMSFAPVGVGMAFLFHSLGMMFTTCLHCNYDLVPNLSKNHWFRNLVNDPAFHRMHHTKGNVNFGFTTSIMDRLFGTYDANMFDDIK